MSMTVKARPRSQGTLRGYVGMSKAMAISGASATWLRIEADTGRIRCLRDPSGRRLLWLEDVEAYAARRRAGKSEPAAGTGTS